MKRKKITPITSYFAKAMRKEVVQSSTPSSIPISTQNSSPHQVETSPIQIHQEDTPPAQNHQKTPSTQNDQEETSPTQNDQDETFSNRNQEEVEGRLTQDDIVSLPSDPGMRRPMCKFHPNDREIVQREYIRRRPCQPDLKTFPKTLFGQNARRFNPKWYEKYKPWLEYSVSKDAVFCFACYLFKSEVCVGGDAFVSEGFRTWKKTNSYDKHVGNVKSAHNKAMEKLENLKKRKASISNCFDKQFAVNESAFKKHLD